MISDVPSIAHVAMGGCFKPSGAKEVAMRAKIRARRTGLTDEIAQGLLGLLLQRFCSDIASTTFVVDGGLSLYNWIADEPVAHGSGTGR
jgi:hypothetical protein